MNSAPQNEQHSPKWTVLPKENGAPQYEHLKKTNLRKMAIFATETWTKLAKTNFVIRYLCWEGILGKKIGLIGHSSP